MFQSLRDVGRCALTRLNEQGEALHRAEVVADSNQYVVDRSQRVVDNMTWSGWLANKFTKAPKPAAPPPPPTRDGARLERRRSAADAWESGSSAECVADRSALFAGARAPHEARPASKTEAALAEQDAYLRAPGPTKEGRKEGEPPRRA